MSTKVMSSRLADDPFAELKAMQREGWKHYAPLENHTVRAAANLVRVAGVLPGQRVLDVACGTGPVAITARLRGAVASGLDLTPELLARARQNADIAGVDDLDFREGDVEALPYDDESFDVVLSQFGHIFAPRPDRALNEMLRVLKPGGTIAFSTWTPEAITGRIFATVGKHGPPPPPGAPKPVAWGEVPFITGLFGDRVEPPYFEHGVMEQTVLSPAHMRMELEGALAPMIGVVQSLRDDPARLASFRREFEAAVAPYIRDNAAHLEYLVTRATKK